MAPLTMSGSRDIDSKPTPKPISMQPFLMASAHHTLFYFYCYMHKKRSVNMLIARKILLIQRERLPAMFMHACSPDAQFRLTVVAGTSFGMPLYYKYTLCRARR